METFKIVMIGNTAVGKTSMLAALSKELDKYNTARDVALEPTTHEFKVLQKQWIEMNEQVEAQTPFTTLSAGIEGALVDFVDHKFDFKVKGKTQAHVLFTDTRGAMTGDLDDKLVDRVNKADGVFCVVDASVLMECPGSKNERYNCPDFVKELLKKVYVTDGDDFQPRFVAFVLTKCEKQMASAKGRRELSKRFHEKYDNIVDMLGKAKMPPSVYLLAIQTMVRVSFSKLNKDGWPEFKINPPKYIDQNGKKTEIKTKDCAYPLVVSLRELIEKIEEADSKGFFGPFVRLLKWLGLLEDLRDYLSEIDDKIEEPDLYEEL